MSTIEEQVVEAAAEALQSLEIKKYASEAAEKAIKAAIDDAFNYNSTYRKALQENIRKVLPIVEVEDLAHFAAAVRDVVQQRLVNLANETAQEHVGKLIERLVPDSPIVTLAELREEYERKLMQDRAVDDNCECREEEDLDYAWHIESGGADGYWDLWMNDDPEASRYGSGSMSLRFRKCKGTNLHECWHFSGDTEKRFEKGLFSGPLYGFDVLVFRLVSGTSKLRKD